MIQPTEAWRATKVIARRPPPDRNQTSYAIEADGIALHEADLPPLGLFGGPGRLIERVMQTPPSGAHLRILEGPAQHCAERLRSIE